MKLDEQITSASEKLLNQSENILITNHLSPDGDAMGGALGLFAALRNAGKNVKVVVPNNYPDFLKWMEGSDKVLIFEENEAEASGFVENSDLIFHLDYNSLKRSGPMEEVLTGAKAKKIIIDHHQQPQEFADVLYSDPGMSSTCEMVFHFLKKLEMGEFITPAAAECLYAGLITDTGNFRFSSTTPTTHEVASELLRLGVQPNEVASKIYDSNRPERLKLLSRALDRMEMIREYGTAIISLRKEDLEEFDYRKGDTEGFVNYGLSVAGVEFTAFIYSKDDQVKMSFRSKSDFDVNAFARAHFEGGGHLNAAGGVSYQTLEETIEKFKEVLPQYENSLPTI